MKVLLLLMIALPFCLVVTGQTKTYSNPQFNYSIEYSSELFTLDEKYLSPDGARFTSSNPPAKMRVWAKRTTKPDVSEDYAAFLNRFGSAVIQKQSTKDSFLIKYSTPNGISFIKALHRKWKDQNTIYMLTIDFPPAQEEKFGRAAEQTAASFKLLPGDQK